MTKIIEINGLVKSFQINDGKQTITPINGVSLDVMEGKFLGVVGPSGSGKSTIIKCIYRTYKPNSGTILYHSTLYGLIDLAVLSDRQIIELRKKEVGYISQFLSVMPRVTAKDVIIESIRETGLSVEEAMELAIKTLKQFNIPQELWDSYPQTFSGGEKLRLNIARAIVKKPRLLLLDEPTASLDNNSKQLVKEAIVTLKKENTTMIGIFHDLEFMDDVCDDIYRIEGVRNEN